MRVLWTVLLLVGCGFRPQQAAGTQDGAPSDGSPDAFVKVFEDAPPKVFMDAPPCADVDGDGVCDTVDAWLCGENPTPPLNHVELLDNGGKSDFKLTSIAVDGQGTMLNVQHNSNLRIQMHYVGTDTACGDCQDQLEVGFDPTGSRLGCIFDMDVPSNSGRTGDINNTSFNVPSTPGAYDLHIHFGQKNSCDMGGNFYYGGNEGTDVIAKLCVQ